MGLKNAQMIVQSNDYIYVDFKPRFASSFLTEITPWLSLLTTALLTYSILVPKILAEDKQQIALNTDFNPQIIREIVRRHWFLPIIYIFLFSTIAFFYLRYTKPMYRSSAKIQIIEEDKVGDVLGKMEQNVSMIIKF